MEKAPDAFRTISEVAQDLDLPQHVLRFWETRFQQIKPLKRGGGRRYYRPDDIDLLRGIRHLLYGEGYTIRGAQRIIKDNGIKFVQNVWKASAPQPAARPGAGTAAGGGAATREPPPEDDVIEPLTKHAPLPGSARRHEGEGERRLFGLLHSFLSASSPKEERIPDEPEPERGEQVMTLPSPLMASAAANAGLPAETLSKLKGTLHELQECRRLLDAAVAES